MLILGRVRIGPSAGARNREKRTPKLIFNKPRSSIKPESAPDPIILSINTR